MRVTVLVENDTARPDLRSEHGLALWIETGEHSILFDTGASDAVVANATLLGIDLSTADAIVISHGHYDHTGGLAAVARRAGGAAIYAGPNVTEPKYARKEGGLREVGLDHQTINAVAHRLRVAQDDQILVPGVHVVSGFPADFPLPADNDRLLVRGPEGMRPDPFTDEIALVVDTREGAVLISGCSHSGIGNIVAKALSRTGQLVGIIGGFHLHKEGDQTVREVAKSLEGIARIHTAHCTGSQAVDTLRSILGPKLARFRAGSVIEIG